MASRITRETTAEYMAAMDPFGYYNAAAFEVGEAMRSIEPERDELREVMVELRTLYGRRRLFRNEEVAAVVREVRARRGDATLVRQAPATERRRLQWTMNDM